MTTNLKVKWKDISNQGINHVWVGKTKGGGSIQQIPTPEAGKTTVNILIFFTYVWSGEGKFQLWTWHEAKQV